MPTPDRTSLDAIVGAARELLERDGLAALTMQAVALRVGVRAPSLYKRVQSRDDLIQLVAEASLTELAERLNSAPNPVELANRFRAFGHERPAAFQLIMTPATGIPVARPEFGAAASEAVLALAAELAGPDRALEAARTLTAWAAGFVSMELNGSFRLGGDVDRAWHFGAAAIIEAIRAPRSVAPAPEDAAQRVPFNPRYYDSVASGRKTITVRYGESIREGSAVFEFGAGETVRRLSAEIASIESRRFDQLSHDDARREDLPDSAALRRLLRTHYPEIGNDDLVDVVSFHSVRPR
jgi:AcrR family transcriptional regulator/uncharacterized protein YqfB (UPF0267 family)